ncbi:hypothetical protein V2J09_004117 [Rumex salicifolius]
MAATLAVLPAIESSHHHHLPFQKLQSRRLCKRPSLHLHPYLSKQNPYFRHHLPPLSASQSSDPSPASPSFTYPGRFLTSSELESLEFLHSYTYQSELPSGSLRIRTMRTEELDVASSLLAESFNEAMVWPSGYVNLLKFLVKNYLIERRAVLPHAITLLGFYRQESDDGDSEGELAGTVEVSFDKLGANASPPTPTPPKNCPYICNMTVNIPLRRRGIGWHLLKASEQLISQMTSSREVYLHCRLIDSAPLSMYKKAGYEIVKTDSILALLSLQRRKHLMRKILPSIKDPSDLGAMVSEELTPL